METKTAAGSLVALVLALILLAPPAYAETPTYDMTGTWKYELTNGWHTCPGSTVPDDSGTSLITQAGNSITLNEPGDEDTDHGTVDGNRYRFTRWSESDNGMESEVGVWVLQSSTMGSGHFLGAWSDGQSYCNWGGILKLTKLPSSGCQSSDTVMCLQNGRYSVIVTWKDQDGKTGVGHAVPTTDDSGLFWFFSPSNMELLIKVLNGCTINSRYWIFFAATTDQEFKVTVTDTKTMEVVEYTNPLKNPADAVTDTDAFATCP